MTLFTDYAGRTVRLTDERRTHLLSHPEMVALEPLLGQAISSPEVVVRSRADEAVLLYYRGAVTEQFGAKLSASSSSTSRRILLWSRPT